MCLNNWIYFFSTFIPTICPFFLVFFSFLFAFLLTLDMKFKKKGSCAVAIILDFVILAPGAVNDTSLIVWLLIP